MKPVLTERLAARFPEFSAERVCLFDHPGVRSPIALAKLFAGLILELQRAAGCKVEYAEVFSTGRKFVFDVVHEFETKEIGAAAALLALATVIDLVPEHLRPTEHRETGFDFEVALRAFQTFASVNQPEPALLEIARAARARDIPVYALTRNGVLQLGQGIRQIRIGTQLTTDKGAIWSDLVQITGDFLKFLHESGIPVPMNLEAHTNDEIRAAARELDFPVEIRAGEATAGDSAGMHLAGKAELEAFLEKRTVDDAATVLADRDPSQKHVFLIHKTGETIDIAIHEGSADAATIHDDNRDMLERALAATGLDEAFVCVGGMDLSRSHLDAEATIRSIKPARPAEARGLHREGDFSPSQLVDILVPEPEKSRIPVACITGSNGKTTTSYLTAHIVRLAGLTTGLATTYGALVNGRLIEKGDLAGAHTARILLQDPRLEVAVLETAYGGLSKYGLGPGECTVGAVINVTSDHVGKGSLKSVDDLAEYKSIVVRNAREAAILNADDPRCLKMHGVTPAKKICLVTKRPGRSIVDEHEEAGFPSARLIEGPDGSRLVLFDGKERHDLCDVEQVPITFGGAAEHNVENALFAAAIAFHLGIDIDFIREGLVSFRSDFDQLPGRANFFEGFPFQVMIDYAHNPEGMETITRMIDRLKIQGSNVCALTSPGDRPNAQIVDLARVAAPHFDRFFLCPEDDPRGRKPKEITGLLSRGLLDAGVPAERIAEMESEKAAVAAALDHAREGDFVALFIAGLDATRHQIEETARARNAAFSPGTPSVNEVSKTK